MKNDQNEHVDLDNARYDDQRAVMQEIIENDESPFLLKNLRKYHTKKVVREGKYWYVTENQWPYDHTKRHFLIIAQEYWTKLSDITPEAGAEMFELAQWVAEEYGVQGGAICMRFGDTNLSAGTVQHLHVQFIEPDREAEGFKPVRFKIGKEKQGEKIEA